MLFASLAAGLTVLLDRGFGLNLEWLWPAGIAALTLLGFLLPALLRSEPLESATIELDSNLGLSDRVTTGVAFSETESTGPFEQLALRDAEEAAASVRVREGVPLRLTRVHRWWPLTTVAAIAMAVWLPMLTTQSDTPRAETASEREKREQAQERVAEALEDATQAIDEQPELFSEQTRRDLEALQRIEDELSQERADAEAAEAQAAEALSEAAERLDAEAQLAERVNEATRQRFEGAAGDDPLGDALAEGDYDSVREELAAIEEMLENASQDEREQTAERLREIAEQIDTSEGEQTPSAEERLQEEGVDPETAREMAEQFERQGDQQSVQESLEQQGADPIEAQRISEQLEQDAQQREAQRQAQRNAQSMQESLQRSAEQCEKPGSGQSESQNPSEQNTPGANSPQGSGQQSPSGESGDRQPGEGSTPGLQQTQELSRDLSRQNQQGQQGSQTAERLREQASRLAQRPQPTPPNPNAGTGSVPPRTVQPPARNDALRTDSLDARRGSDSTRVRAEVEAQGPALPERSASPAQAQRTLQEAAPAAERALESQGVPARYRDLVRRYFRQREQAAERELAPTSDDDS